MVECSSLGFYRIQGILGLILGIFDFSYCKNTRKGVLNDKNNSRKARNPWIMEENSRIALKRVPTVPSTSFPFRTLVWRVSLLFYPGPEPNLRPVEPLFQWQGLLSPSNPLKIPFSDFWRVLHLCLGLVTYFLHSVFYFLHAACPLQFKNDCLVFLAIYYKNGGGNGYGLSFWMGNSQIWYFAPFLRNLPLFWHFIKRF